ncbi:sporulation integral membrane protein YtvI [Siminovitchia sediminis]|uniref:Sporulation integral membrane protein YtvI n=1 Tax=Siminovitchia sediminis TaxID=1274353 RepID=A0ABW4KKU3_9BACI
MNRENADRIVRFFIVLLVTAGSLISIYYIAKVTYPFIIALIFAAAMNPAVNFIEKRWKFPRALAVFVTLILLIGIFTGLITLLIAEIVSGASYLATVVPEHVANFISFIESWFASQVIPFYNNLAGMFQSLDSGQQDTIMKSITDTGSKITENVTAFLQNFFLKLPGLVSWIPNAATVIIFSLLATFFISKDWNRLNALAGRLFPERVKNSGARVFEDLKKALAGFVKAQITLISITLVIILIGLLIMRINYAITIALIMGVLDLLPYLGTGLVFVPWIIYEVLTGDFGLALGLAILYTVVVVQRQIMEPKILSSNIGLNPLGTLIALFVGFKLVGFLGLIIGPVTLVLLTTLHKANVFKDIWAYIMGKPPKAIE